VRAAAKAESPELVMVVHARYPIGEPRVEREARAAVDAGWRVSVVCLREKGEPRHESVQGVQVTRLPLTHRRGANVAQLLGEYAAFTGLASAVLAWRSLWRRPAVVQVHAPPDFLALAGVVPRLLGSRLLLDIHDLSRHMFGARFEGRRGMRAVTGGLAVVERLACRLADDVVTVHEPYRGEIQALGVPSSKLHVVMNSVDPAIIERAHAVRAERGQPSRELRIAYHGTVNYWYGVDLVVRALGDLIARGIPARLVVLGEGDALQEVRELVAELGLDDRVEFSGRYLPIVETLERVAACDCGVVPNRPTPLNRFALSSKLFEYVELGIPAVVAELETLGAHFASDEVRFFAAGDASRLADELAWIASNRENAAAMAERARRRAESYTWERSRVEYLKLLGVTTDGRAAAG
jgi:glycosyltransferase involved in cell wall biosynthesis